MDKKVAFIGHRNIGFGPIRNKLKLAIENEIKDGCKNFIMGTHGSFDELALSVCRELRQSYSDVIIEVVITSLKQIEKKLYYSDDLGQDFEKPYSDVCTLIYEIDEAYFKNKITISNRKMIDSCSALICYVNKKHNPSGAKRAMNYAVTKGIRIINLYDEKYEPTFNMTKEEKKEFFDKFFNI